jgi:hypothetical protein
MKPRFNDDFYNRSVEEFENEVVPARCVSDYIGWSCRLLPAILLIGVIVAGTNWQYWVIVIALAYPLVTLFTFLEEINENIRFVRHQARAFRDAVSAMRKHVDMYKDPDRNFTLNDALVTLDREWEDPHPYAISKER